ncbi:MAG: hypothetical protein HQL93_02840 [Magnetococcales bacterium]|nr:hypothetical protein [Magnetococcales bacterium]
MGIWARIVLLSLLPVIAWGIYRDGQRYDSGLLDFTNAAARLSSLAGFFPEQVAGLSRLGEMRRFGKENLHEYINGHAEFFIGAGFKELMVGEYGVPGEGVRPRVVVDLYDMGKPLYAFGVVTGEGVSDAREVAIGEMGFLDSRGLRFIFGPFYLKMTAFEDNAPLEAMAKAVVQAMGKAGGQGVQTFRFPEFGTVRATRFIKDNYRGLDFFDQVVERSFQWEERVVQAFIVGSSEQESREMESRLLAFLQKEEIPVVRREEEGGVVVFAVTDPYEGEWFFLREREQLIGAFGLSVEAALVPLKRFIEDGRATQSRKVP